MIRSKEEIPTIIDSPKFSGDGEFLDLCRRRKIQSVTSIAQANRLGDSVKQILPFIPSTIFEIILYPKPVQNTVAFCISENRQKRLVHENGIDLTPILSFIYFIFCFKHYIKIKYKREKHLRVK